MAESRIVLEVLKGETGIAAADLDDAAGRALSAGVSRDAASRPAAFSISATIPDFAVEVTLQPIRRFGFDASILFSDILVVPHALGRDLRFEEGRGPLLTPIDADEIDGSGRSGVPRPSGAGLRDGAAAARRTAGRDDADRLLRRALDGGDLHDRRARHAGPGAGAAVCLSPSGGDGAAAGDLCRAVGGLSDPADRGRRRCGADLRFLVGRARRGELSRPAASSRWPRSSAGAGRASGRADHRLSRRAPACRYDGYRAADRRDARSGSTGRCRCRRRSALQAQGAVQGNLDPLRLVAGGEALDDGVDAILRRARRWSADLQSRPRHHAGDADRACRGDGGAGAREHGR